MLLALLFVTLAALVAADFDPELHNKYLTMPKSSFIEYFNAQGYSWKMTEYDNIEEKFAGCEYFDEKSMEKLPLLTHDLEGKDLPEKFDARDKWPQCETIKEIYDQGLCGSCWAFGTATTASDRTCIHKDVHVRLSEQDLECLKTNVCKGGYSGQAFDFWKKEGLVSHECKPYNIDELEKNQCVTECVKPELNYKQDKHFAENVYGVANNSNQIKAELVKNGPIQTGFEVYEDIVGYESGIYVHTHGDWMGRHSVRIIGYGVQDGMDYWLVANSWGSGWGKQGWFKIKSYQKDLNFEDSIHSGIPKN